MFTHTCLKVQTGVNMQKEICRNGKISREKTVETIKYKQLRQGFK